MTDADYVCLLLADRYCFHLDPNALMRTCHCSVQPVSLKSVDVQLSKASEYSLCLFVEVSVAVAVLHIFRFFRVLFGGGYVEVRCVVTHYALTSLSTTTLSVSYV